MATASSRRSGRFGAPPIPVIGKSDVTSGEDARRMREETRCADVMIARRSHGDPGIFARARAALNGDPPPPKSDVDERFAICLEHARNVIDFERDARRRTMLERYHSERGAPA